MKVTTMAINFHNKLIKIDNEDDRDAILKFGNGNNNSHIQLSQKSESHHRSRNSHDGAI